MPYREIGRAGPCRHCRAQTSNACTRCAHHVCGDCETRHDAEFAHRDYTG